MPELPEVHTIVAELNRQVLRRRILSCRIARAQSIHGESEDFVRSVTGKKIGKVERRGKYILFGLDRNIGIVAHLRMTGKFVVSSKFCRYRRHDRVALLLDDNRKIVFNDPRCFGRLEVCDNIAEHPGIKKLGWEPWDGEVSVSKLLGSLKGKTAPIKNLLMDQTLIAGIGNIYASEMLYDAKIDPFRESNSLNGREIARLIRSMRHTLEEAIACNGTSVSNYRRVDDKTGDYQNFLKVYGREGKECPRCMTPILREKQNQRSTFLCPNCQR